MGITIKKPRLVNKATFFPGFSSIGLSEEACIVLERYYEASDTFVRQVMVENTSHGHRRFVNVTYEVFTREVEDGYHMLSGYPPMRIAANQYTDRWCLTGGSSAREPIFMIDNGRFE